MNYYKGIIHFHSVASYDSVLKVKDIVKFALKRKLNFLILTDHENICGSINLKRYIEKKKYPIEVILAAEYNTNYGDIIALNINKEITDLCFVNFIKEVKKQGGILLFPHPYKGHTKIQEIASKVDMIEVFNSRVDYISNQKAYELMKNYKLPGYYASDAHCLRDLGNAIIFFENKGGLIYSLLNSKITTQELHKTRKVNIYYSQIIKCIKLKKAKLFIYIVKCFIKSILNRNLFKKV